MSAKAMIEKVRLRAILHALAAWAAAALLLLLLAALIMRRTGMSSACLGYLSSAVSFLAAVAAGLISARQQGRGLVPTLITATVLVILLLCLGFLICGRRLDSSAVLSLVSFTYAGCLMGSLFFGGKPGKRRSGRRKGGGFHKTAR